MCLHLIISNEELRLHTNSLQMYLGKNLISQKVGHQLLSVGHQNRTLPPLLHDPSKLCAGDRWGPGPGGRSIGDDTPVVLAVAWRNFEELQSEARCAWSSGGHLILWKILKKTTVTRTSRYGQARHQTGQLLTIVYEVD